MGESSTALALQRPTRLGRVRTAIAAALIAVMSVVAFGVGTGEAEAHTSSYCGHGVSGIVDLTIFVYGIWYSDGNHDHLQYHDMLFSSNHYKWRWCGARWRHW